MKDQAIYISAPAKIAIGGLVTFLFVSSFGLSLYLLLQHPTGMDNIISSAISLAQTCATAAGFLIVLFFSRFSMNLNDLRERSDRFLADDIPRAFEAIDYVPAPMGQRATTRLADSRRVKVVLSFVRGTNLAVYRVDGHGITQQLSIMLNVRRMVVSYVFPAVFDHEDAQLDAAFGLTVAGAQHAGYLMEWRRVPGDDIGPDRLELRALVNLPEDFLIHPAERLFRCNDIAIMTRSIMKAHAHYLRSAALPPAAETPALQPVVVPARA
jgi:hypothetical protein